MKRVVAQMHMGEVTIAYGMTETSPGVVPELDRPTRWSGACRRSDASSRTSKPRWSMTSGDIVPVGQTGELCVRGYSVMKRLLGRRRRAPAKPIDGRLDAHWRPGDDRRPGLLQHRRPRQGHAHPRRRECLSARDRGISVPPSRRCSRCRCSACPTAKYGEEVCAWIVLKPGDAGHRRRDPRLLQGPDRALQGAALHPLRERDADDDHRQGAEVRDARADDRRAQAPRPAKTHRPRQLQAPEETPMSAHSGPER